MDLGDSEPPHLLYLLTAFCGKIKQEKQDINLLGANHEIDPVKKIFLMKYELHTIHSVSLHLFFIPLLDILEQ